MLNLYFQNLMHSSFLMWKNIMKANAVVISESYEFDLGKTE